nr:MAG TPA: hypothetical protein [Caudoviricetes sp.]
MLTMDMIIDSPRLVAGGVGAYRGTLGEAFPLDGDRMTDRLESLCESWGVGDLDEWDASALLADLARAGVDDETVASYLFDDPNISLAEAE